MTAHDHNHAHRHRRERRAPAAKVCKACQGKGAVRSVYPSAKDHACYWFNEGARTCEKCDGTGEGCNMPAEPLEGGQDARNDFGQARTAQKGRKAVGARKNGDSA